MEDTEPEDILTQHESNLWEHPEGQILLGKLYELGVGLHNVGNRSKEAIAVFRRMLRQDPQDHLVGIKSQSELICFLTCHPLLQNRYILIHDLQCVLLDTSEVGQASTAALHPRLGRWLAGETARER